MRLPKDGTPKPGTRAILSMLREIRAEQVAQRALLRDGIPVLRRFQQDTDLRAAFEADQQDRSVKRRTVIDRARAQGLLPARKVPVKRGAVRR